MADVIDRANAHAEQLLAARIRQVTSMVTAKTTTPNIVVDCVDCGEPIGDQRKAAMPSAIRCLACQQAKEAKR